jgi:hypothetical protein
MAFPNDLNGVVVFKIHPAIGIARLSVNEDYFVFGPEPDNYKSNGLMKRQAVQFHVFGYGDNHVGLGELTADLMKTLGITAVWSTKVANRKIARQIGTPLNGTTSVISAEASSDKNEGKLTGSLPGFDEGAQIALGQITSTGLFIPPLAGVFRQKRGASIPGFPGTNTIADNSCDGTVTVRLIQGGQPVGIEVLPACIVVCPQDFSPDTTESWRGKETLVDYFKRTLEPAGSNPYAKPQEQAARALDKAALEAGTADFHPGVEMSFGQSTEVADIKSVFYQNSQNPKVDPREMRIRYKSGQNDQGAVPGQLTSGLCSPWQADYAACIGYWTEHLPAEVYSDENSSTIVQMFRKKSSDMSPSAETLVGDADGLVHVDKVGVARLRLGSGRKVETGRQPSPDGDIEDKIA